MYTKLDYFKFSAFHLEMKATEILKYILLISEEKNINVSLMYFLMAFQTFTQSSGAV